jgi:hypothetical protein
MVEIDKIDREIVSLLMEDGRMPSAEVARRIGNVSERVVRYRIENLKTYKNLYPQIYPFRNLYLAFQAARKGKRNRVAIASFEFDLESNAPDYKSLQDFCSLRRRPFPHSAFFAPVLPSPVV